VKNKNKNQNVVIKILPWKADVQPNPLLWSMPTPNCSTNVFP